MVLFFHTGAKQHDAVAAFVLGPVHSNIRLRECPVKVPILRNQRNTNGDGYPNRLPGVRDDGCRFNRTPYPFRRCERSHFIRTGKHHQKLFAAMSSDIRPFFYLIIATNCVTDDPYDALEYIVADIVSVCIIDSLEVVKIDEKKRKSGFHTTMAPACGDPAAVQRISQVVARREQSILALRMLAQQPTSEIDRGFCNSNQRMSHQRRQSPLHLFFSQFQQAYEHLHFAFASVSFARMKCRPIVRHGRPLSNSIFLGKSRGSSGLSNICSLSYHILPAKKKTRSLVRELRGACRLFFAGRTADEDLVPTVIFCFVQFFIRPEQCGQQVVARLDDRRAD